MRTGVVLLVPLVLACPRALPERGAAAAPDAGAPVEKREASPDPEGALARAKEALAMGLDAEAAVVDARAAVAGLPESAEAHRTLGQALDETGQSAAARAAYAQAAQLGDAWSRRRLASLASAEGALEEAIAQWEALREADPTDASTHLELAALYEQADRPATAEAALRAALEAAPGNVAVVRRLAEFLERHGKLAEARRIQEGLESSTEAPRKMRELPKSRR